MQFEIPCKPCKNYGLQKNIQIISTHLLTVLIISVILQLEQREEQKGSKKKSFRKVPIKVPEIKNEPLQIDKFLKER